MLTYEEIANKLYDNDLKVDALRTLIKRLRSKLRVNIIETIPKEGYKLIVSPKPTH
ncbi:hypothetical protein MNB_SM-7-657 [hydrothermal vent metagenome]|uniref:OmpR/PhoB-type domain-containing protein n=1 Tax=hydrothermal vent metagenome TaxID=652676 RepID=A0A1W1BMW9_9ZZZZ